MKRTLSTVLLLAGCRGASPVQPPMPEVGFTGWMEGRVLPFTGSAVFARCHDEVHLFLLTTTLPRTSLTLHPMGFPLRGVHPLLPSRAIEAFRHSAPPDSLPGLFLLSVENPPQALRYADSGTVRMTESSDGEMRGHVEAWLDRRVVSTFFTARRDSVLEGTLRDGEQCSR